MSEFSFVLGDMKVVATATVTHPEGTLLDENGHPVLDDHGNPIIVKD